jgi:hypothetical protein
VEENTTRNVKPLNEFIEKEFKINPPPPPAEIMFSRGELAHASMSELENSPEIKALGGNPDKNSNTYTEAVKRAYERRIESLREIATKEFERLVMQNRRKYQSTDPRYISREAAELSQFAINRAKNAFDKTDPDKDARLLNQIQTTSTLVATLGVLGFRGNINSSDASPDRMMILEQRYEQLLTNKDDIRSDLGKVIIESASPVDKLDTANFEFNNVKQYVENNLTLKVLSQLATPDSAKIFRTEGNISSTQMRAAILKFAASRNDQPAPAIDEATKAALKQLTEITDGIRLAEVTGQTEFRLKHDPNISIQITEFTVADGVYKKCTNYSMWMNESLRLSVVGEVKPTLYSGAAGYGLGKQEIIPSEGGKVMTLVLGAAVRVKVKKERIVNKSENIGKKTTGGLEPEPDAEGTISIGEAVIPADVATKGQDAIQAWLAANGYDPNGNLIPGGGAAPTTGGGL